MFTRSKLLFAALAAAAMMLALVANASARNLSVSERNFELLFSRGLTFEAAGNPIDCPLTLLGRFSENTIAKTLNANIGTINHTEPTTEGSPPCTGGSYTVLTETLPWRVTYQGFTGRLPEIERIRLLLIGVSFQVRTSGGTTCLAVTSTRSPAAGEAILNRTTGRVESLVADETVNIPLNGGILCAFTGGSHFIGTATVLNLPGDAALTVTLI